MAERTSRNLLFFDREGQLCAAMAAKFSQQHGGRAFTAEEFQYLDQDTKLQILLTNPDLLHPEMATYSQKLFTQYSAAKKSQATRVASDLATQSATALTKAQADLDRLRRAQERQQQQRQQSIEASVGLQ